MLPGTSRPPARRRCPASAAPDRVIDSIRRTRVALKGPVTTPVGAAFGASTWPPPPLTLYANVWPARSIAGIASRYEDVDLVIVRENTEDLYARDRACGGGRGGEHQGHHPSRLERIARYAFEYAVANGRQT